MKRSITTIMLLSALAQLAGCVAGDWPDRTNKSPQAMLADLIRWQQQTRVRTSTGEYAYECFTDVDYRSFGRNKIPARIVERLKQAPDFREMAKALRSLPPDERGQMFRAARLIARPTWRMMGYIDRSGGGQTEAGHQAELEIAAALVDAFTVEIGDR